MLIFYEFNESIFSFATVIRLSFEQRNYMVNEADAGIMDNVVYVIKEDGRASEQTLRVLVQAAPDSGDAATRGIEKMKF